MASFLVALIWLAMIAVFVGLFTISPWLGGFVVLWILAGSSK